MTESNPIEKIRARLDGGNKWHKGGMTNFAGSVCVMGAAMDLLPGQLRYDTYRSIEPVILEQFPERADAPGWSGPIAAFNDHDDTTWPDVELVLDKASLRWEESRAAV